MLFHEWALFRETMVFVSSYKNKLSLIGSCSVDCKADSLWEPILARAAWCTEGCDSACDSACEEALKEAYVQVRQDIIILEFP